MSSYLDKKFINMVSPQLDKFSWKRDTLANCRCPICGDSKKNPNKCRGFFYQKESSFFYMCHNCGHGCNVYNFLKDVSPNLCKEYSLEQFKDGRTPRKKKDINEMLFAKPKFKPKCNYLKPLTCVNDLPANHECVRFLEFRHIPKKHWNLLYYTDDYGAYTKLLDSENKLFIGQQPRLVIPIFNKADEVVGAQGRSLSMKDEFDARNTAKYITVKADKSIDRLWFGMWRANPDKRIYAVEGPLDSLFIDNTVAMLGAAAIESVPSRMTNGKGDIVFVLDNEPRNRQVADYNEKIINLGHKVCIWPSWMKYKDINDMIADYSPKKIKKIIDDNVYKGAAAILALQKWRR